MPRPRFQKLAPEKRKALLDVAAEEFAEKGFADASYNRIIEKSGLAKGVLYYYFDDKEDLYLTVLERALSQMMEQVELLASPQSASDFWVSCRRAYLQILQYALKNPQIARLARSYVHARFTPRLREAFQKLEASFSAVFIQILTEGQRVGAVRQDLPLDFLVPLVFGILQAADVWALERWDEIEEAELVTMSDRVFSILQRVLVP